MISIVFLGKSIKCETVYHPHPLWLIPIHGPHLACISKCFSDACRAHQNEFMSLRAQTFRDIKFQSDLSQAINATAKNSVELIDKKLPHYEDKQPHYSPIFSA